MRYLLEAIGKRLAYTGPTPRAVVPTSRPKTATRAQALQHVLDKIIEASLPEHVPQPASLALDGTGLESWGQGQEAIDGRGIGRAGTGDSRERPRSDRR